MPFYTCCCLPKDARIRWWWSNQFCQCQHFGKIWSPPALPWSDEWHAVPFDQLYDARDVKIPERQRHPLNCSVKTSWRRHIMASGWQHLCLITLLRRQCTKCTLGSMFTLIYHLTYICPSFLSDCEVNTFFLIFVIFKLNPWFPPKYSPVALECRGKYTIVSYTQML